MGRRIKRSLEHIQPDKIEFNWRRQAILPFSILPRGRVWLMLAIVDGDFGADRSNCRYG
jgi:hypothetical protein